MGRKSSYRRDSVPRIHQCNPRSRLPTLNATIHRYQTRYQPGILKCNSTSGNKTCLWRTLIVGNELICYLFFSVNRSFSVIYFSPPGGVVKTKKVLHTLQMTSRKTCLSQKGPLDFESFLEILFRLVLKHHCRCLRFRCLYLLPRSNRDRGESG